MTEVIHEESVDRDIKIIPAVQKTEEISEITVKPREVTVKDKPTEVLQSQVRIDEETSRKKEILIKQAVITDSQKEETRAPGKVSLKKQEKPKSDDIDTIKVDVSKKPKPEVEMTPKVEPKESVTDILLEKPKVIQQESEEVYKKKEESKYIPPQRGDVEKTKEETHFFIEDTVETKPSIPLKPEGKKWISPQTTSKGTERKTNIMTFSIVNSSSLSLHSIFSSCFPWSSHYITLMLLCHIFSNGFFFVLFI